MIHVPRAVPAGSSRERCAKQPKPLVSPWIGRQCRGSSDAYTPGAPVKIKAITSLEQSEIDKQAGAMRLWDTMFLDSSRSTLSWAS